MPPAVAMLAGVFPPLVGGIQTQVLQLGRKLVERGVEVHVLTRHLPGSSREEELDGVRVHRVGNGDAPRGVRAATYLLGALEALRSMRHRIDLLHAHQLFAPTAVAMVGRALARKPLLINPHNHTEVAHLERHAPGRLLLAAARATSHAFISICRPVREELERIGVEPERIHDIPNGVDTERFRPASAADRLELRRALGLPAGPLVIYAGRLARVKGLDVLLHAWPAVDAGAHLCIVGDGEEGVALRAQASGLRGIRFHGALTDVAPLLRAADVCVLPSRGEGLPVALLEAMSSGLAVVATAVGGVPEAIEDGKTGLLVPPEAPHALAEALRRALGPAAAGLGQLARARALQSYSVDAVADRVLDLYRKVLREGARSRAFGVAP
jgi:glycosyltransferase involved in cell wall biosynthesis